jgi:hypothetical protein
MAARDNLRNAAWARHRDGKTRNDVGVSDVSTNPLLQASHPVEANLRILPSLRSLKKECNSTRE